MRILSAIVLTVLVGVASAQEPITAKTSPDRFLLQIRLVHGDAAAQAYLGPGAPMLHGREFGPAVRLALNRGEIKAHPGRHRFEVELRNFVFPVMRGAIIRVSRLEEGKLALKAQFIPQEFGAPDQYGRPRHALGVDVLDGVGWVEVLVPWVSEDGLVVARAPDGLPLLRPKSPHRSLATCPRAYVATNLCGSFPDMNVSELANLVRHAPLRVTDMMFVTDEPKRD